MTDWIKWAGGQCPVPFCHVLVRYRDGKESKQPVIAESLVWAHSEPRWGRGAYLDIIAYRIVEPTK